MKIYYLLTSPYSRKEIKGVEKKVKKILINHFTKGQKIMKINPLRKIPALESDNGKILFDSPIICDYLDQQSIQALHRGRLETVEC
ncbi:MAG: glutathione S-transferase N-terminal domain-containing protein [Pseudomonadota bacterium]